ncbi:MAG: hypothetical protein ACHQAY_09940 [Hyphomicrobiales bacterium]
MVVTRHVSGMARGAKTGEGWISASRRSRAFALLAGAAALILQLFLAPLHPAGAAPSSTSLAELAALTGQHSVLCADGAGHQPDNPLHGDAECPGLCCQLGHGLAAFLPPAPSVFAVLVGESAEIALPRAASASSPAHAPNAQPRGPPQTV